MTARRICDSEYREAVTEGIREGLIGALPTLALTLLLFVPALVFLALNA